MSKLLTATLVHDAEKDEVAFLDLDVPDGENTLDLAVELWTRDIHGEIHRELVKVPLCFAVSKGSRTKVALAT